MFWDESICHSFPLLLAWYQSLLFHIDPAQICAKICWLLALSPPLAMHLSFLERVTRSPKDISVTYSSPHSGETEQTQTKTASYEICLCTMICFNRDYFSLSPTLTCEAVIGIFLLASLQLSSLCDLHGKQGGRQERVYCRERWGTLEETMAGVPLWNCKPK